MHLRLVLPVLAAALVAPPALAAPAAAAAGELDVVQLDLGQGDAALFRGPCGEVALVDAGDGSRDDITDRMAAWDAGGVRWAAMTHYDADHIGDLADVSVEVPVVYDRGGGPGAKDTATYDSYYAYAEDREHVSVDMGDVLTLSSGAEQVSFTVVSAGTDGTAADEVPVTEENDRGLCLHVEFGEFDMATCGDLNGVDDGARTDVESAVADDLGDVEVAKVNHHGSAYSSNPAFVNGLQANDSCPPGQITEDGFADVPQESGHETAVDCVVHWQVANGRTSAAYEPLTSVTRAQMASFIARLIDQASGQLPNSGVDHFADDNGSTHERNINRLAAVGIVGGRGAGLYDPSADVTRAQMAAFLTRAYDYRAQQHGAEVLAEGADYFTDDDSSTLQREINKAAAAGFTGGYPDGTYQPAGTVRRDQMASFLARVLDLAVEQGMTTVAAASEPQPEPEPAKPADPGDSKNWRRLQHLARSAGLVRVLLTALRRRRAPRRGQRHGRVREPARSPLTTRRGRFAIGARRGRVVAPTLSVSASRPRARPPARLRWTEPPDTSSPASSGPFAAQLGRKGGDSDGAGRRARRRRLTPRRRMAYRPR